MADKATASKNGVLAVAKGVRMSPRKVGVVAALVRGRSVEDAMTILVHTPRRSASTRRTGVVMVVARGSNLNSA